MGVGVGVWVGLDLLGVWGCVGFWGVTGLGWLLVEMLTDPPWDVDVLGLFLS